MEGPLEASAGACLRKGIEFSMACFGFKELLACMRWPFKDERRVFERELARYLCVEYAIGTG